MTLQGFGITLETLTPESAEIVRQWRNQPAILRQMEYQQLVSEEEQQKWLESIQHGSCLYFLIRFKGEPAGMIHLAQIDAQAQTAEAGLFIGESRFSGTGIALSASLLLLDHAFDVLELSNIKAKVKNTNLVAQQYNQLLGFEKERPLNGSFTQFQLAKEVYFSKRGSLQRLVDVF